MNATLSGRLTIIGAVLLVALTVLVIWLLVRLFRNARAELRATGVVLAGPRRPPADWLAEAAACEANGDFRGALRARYRALIAELATRGFVEDVPGRTSGEYRREVTRDLPAVAGDFAGATDLFEDAVYGAVQTGPVDSAHLAGLAERVLSAVK